MARYGHRHLFGNVERGTASVRSDVDAAVLSAVAPPATLDGLPLDQSYPSGHTAASIAVYSGFVLLLTSRFTDSTFRALAWTFAVLVTTFVALSRMYRGMHHPLDVAGGVLVGIGAVLVVLFACRAAGAAADARVRARARA